MIPVVHRVPKGLNIGMENGSYRTLMICQEIIYKLLKRSYGVGSTAWDEKSSNVEPV